MTALFSQHGQLRWLVWLGFCAGLHLLLIVTQWVLFRSIDLSLLNPWTYSDLGWFLTAVWYGFGAGYMWVNE